MNLVRPQTWSHFLKIWKVTPRRTVTRTPRNPVRRSTKSCIKRFKIRIKPNFYMFTFTAWPWLCRGAGCSCRRGSRRWRRSARCPRGRRSRGRRSPRRRSRRSNRWATFFQNQITKSTFIQINFQNFLNLWTLQARYTVRYTNFAHRLFTLSIDHRSHSKWPAIAASSSSEAETPRSWNRLAVTQCLGSSVNRILSLWSLGYPFSDPPSTLDRLTDKSCVIPRYTRSLFTQFLKLIFKIETIDHRSHFYWSW